MTIKNTVDFEHVVCDDCGQGWHAIASADLTCTCGSTNLTVAEGAEVAR